MSSFDYKCESQLYVLILNNNEVRWAPQGLKSQRLEMPEWTKEENCSCDTTFQNPFHSQLNRQGCGTHKDFVRCGTGSDDGENSAKAYKERCCYY